MICQLSTKFSAVIAAQSTISALKRETGKSFCKARDIRTKLVPRTVSDRFDSIVQMTGFTIERHRLMEALILLSRPLMAKLLG